MASPIRWPAAPARRAAPLVIAHRGASARATENTLRAFAIAREAGADAVELDVRLAADREPVVIHDRDLARLAGRPETVAELSAEALAAVELAGGDRVPRLEEALTATEGLLVNIEIKSPRAEDRLASREAVRLVEAVIRCVDRCGAGARCLISSFDPLAVAHARIRRPAWATGLLFHARQALPLRRAAPAAVLRPRALHPEAALVTPPAVDRWHRGGYLVHAWTVNRPERLRELAALGVDAVVVDDPAAARAALS